MENQEFPFLSLNSSSPETLLQNSLDVLEAIQNLSDKMGDAAPHARDYRDMDSYIRARNQYQENRKKISEIFTYYENYGLHVDSMRQ